MSSRYSMRGLSQDLGLFALALAISACSFDMFLHPTACKNTSDCGAGFSCRDDFCIEKKSVNVPSTAEPAAGISDSGVGRDGTGGSGGGSGNASAGGGGGSDPAQSIDGGPAVGDAAVGNTAPMLDGGPDVAMDASTVGPVPPYAMCVDNNACNAGEQCRVSGSRGVCSASCATATDCPTPAGVFTARVVCGTDGRCRVDCASLPGPVLAVTCPTGMTCVQEPGPQSWNPGPKTCFP